MTIWKKLKSWFTSAKKELEPPDEDGVPPDFTDINVNTFSDDTRKVLLQATEAALESFQVRCTLIELGVDKILNLWQSTAIACGTEYFYTSPDLKTITFDPATASYRTSPLVIDEKTSSIIFSAGYYWNRVHEDIVDGELSESYLKIWKEFSQHMHDKFSALMKQEVIGYEINTKGRLTLTLRETLSER